MNIVWNGETLETLGEENIETNNPIYYSMDSDTLFFPKVIEIHREKKENIIL